MIASSAKTPFPLGAYLNAPDGSTASNQAEFQTNYDSFTALMGTSPSFLDYYSDYNQQVSSWISQASWQAWSASLSAEATAATPVIALPMYSLVAGSLTPDQQYQAIISGQDDSVIAGILTAWVDQGFKNLVFRPGWEMNIPGSTYAGDTAQDQSDWVAAFQRIYTVLHQTATAAGVSVSVIWNPSATNYSNAEATTNLYPGNAYVDAIGADVYADIWPFSDTTSGAPLYHDWDTGGEDTSIAQFIADPINRAHYWSYPAATEWALDSSGGHSQSLLSLIQFAEQQGKPFAIPETGAGNGQDVTDDGAFPTWLAAQLTAAQATGETIQYVNLWDSNGGGNYEFSNASDDKPQEAAAFAAAFGVQTATPSPTPTPTPAPTPTPTPAPTPTPTFTPSANDTVVTGTSAAITDAHGNKWTITSGASVAVNGITDTSTSGVIELAYVNGTIWQENIYQRWYGTTGINAAWGPGAGTTTPLPATPTPSANDTVVTGTSTAITDASGNKWTITSNAQVAVNGAADASTSGVIELAYVNGTIWQENVYQNWYGTTGINAPWGPGAGTTTPLPATSTPTPTPTPTTITLNMAQDAWQGDAQFTVTVDGVQQGSTMTASALHSASDSNIFSLTGNWSTGAHTVGIQFINDAYGGSPSTDRNLYVNSIAFNGTTESGTTAALLSAGTDIFAIGGSTPAATSPADTLTLNLAEDAWQGNAQFTLSIDGKQITTLQDVVALHSTGAWEALSFSGNFGTGSHTIGVSFTNDAYGGSPTTDRNLYVNGIDLNGQHYGSGVTALLSNGTATFNVTTAH